MTFFTDEYSVFFQELEQNNNKEWFHANKKRYEEHVRKPLIKFVEAVVAEMQKHDPSFDPVPSKCLSRINRDIRFAKDKTPYNIHMFAHITKGPKENILPGIGFRFGADGTGIMTGFYQPSKERILSIRNKIAKNIDTFQKLKTDKNLVKYFGEIQGEANKRIPPEFKEAFIKEPLIANKQFYCVSHKDAEYVSSNQILEDVVNHWLAARKLNDFLSS